MLKFVPRPTSGLQSQTATATVCIVDPQVDDYRSWRVIADEHGLRLKFFASAAEALRFRHAHAVDLWVVNATLPGLSGLELCEMLNTHTERTTVYMVANEYTADVERQAYRVHASLFGCKPGHESLLHEWIVRRGVPAKQTGPAFCISMPRD